MSITKKGLDYKDFMECDAKDDLNGFVKTYMFLKGLALGCELQQTTIALSLAKRLHSNQVRKDGSPYLLHPLKVASTLVSLGIRDDITLSAALLHDTLEDCSDQLPAHGREFITDFGLDEEVLSIVELLTKESGLNNEELAVYFIKISESEKASLIKLADRQHNSSTLYAFTPEKMRSYIEETKRFILPLASYCKAYYPDMNSQFTILKSAIYSMNHLMEVMLNNIMTLGSKIGE